GAFVASGQLGTLLAVTSSEHAVGDVVASNPSGIQVLLGQLGMGLFCVVTLFALASLFMPLGRLLGDALERVPRLRGYTINLLGSLAGIGVFLVLSRLWAPPWTWLVIGLTPLLWWTETR